MGEVMKNGDIQTRGDEKWRGNQIRQVFEYNQLQVQQHEVDRMKKRFNRLMSMYASEGGGPSPRTKFNQKTPTGFLMTQSHMTPVKPDGSSVNDWSTTSSEFHNGKQPNFTDMKQHRRNFKRKTPFSQWQDAFFGNGVFFNPPQQGI